MQGYSDESNTSKEHNRGRDMKNHEAFTGELSALINRYSGENDSNTPDFLLATYLSDCLKAYNLAVQARDKWHAINRSPGSPSHQEQKP
jgi:hypothetical protein